MVAAKAKHPNCMYKWMNWITSPKVDAQVAEWFGEAPGADARLRGDVTRKHCETYHGPPTGVAKQIAYGRRR
jgi:putative spermidine/putrescine transport system substrate-binding protein